MTGEINAARTKALERIDALVVWEYGIYRRPLADLLAEHETPDCLVVALNNADTEGVLLEVLRQAPQKVFDGMELAAQAAGTDRRILQLPAFAAALAEELGPAAEKNGVSIEVGLLDCRAHSGSVVCHIVTMAELADAAAGKSEPGVWVSVNGAPIKKVPESTTLRALLGGEGKAILTGYTLRGPEAQDLTVGGAEIQNGVLRSITDKDCLVAEVEKALRAHRGQSCGKCVFCREGLIQLDELHRDITSGKGKPECLDLMAEIGVAMRFSTPCSLGQTCAELPLSVLNRFRSEYEEHIKKRCPAGSCLAFVNVYIDPKTCIGCGDCLATCPVEAIDGRAGYIHMVDDFDCTKCGACLTACPAGAVLRTTGRVPALPDRFIKAGKFKRY